MSQAEMAETMQKHDGIMKDLGVVNVITCNSYWCNESYSYFGVDAYPTAEENMKMMQALEGLGWKVSVPKLVEIGW